MSYDIGSNAQLERNLFAINTVIIQEKMRFINVCGNASFHSGHIL